MKPAPTHLPLHLFLAFYLALGAVGHMEVLRIVLHPGGGKACVAAARKLPPAKPRQAVVQASHIPATVKVVPALAPSTIRYETSIRPLFCVPLERSVIRPLDPVRLPSRPRDPPAA